jgi:hypothetical protein
MPCHFCCLRSVDVGDGETAERIARRGPTEVFAPHMFYTLPGWESD